MSKYASQLLCASVLASQVLAGSTEMVGSIYGSTEQTGANFVALLDYSYVGGSTGLLDVTLINDSQPGVGGYLTGFVFNIDSADNAASAELVSATDPDFVGLSDESAPPFGTFDAGAALGGDWTGGGAPHGGIAPGDTATFTFEITASDADALDASSFTTQPNEWNFVARFRGLNFGASDKVPGTTCAVDLNNDGVLNSYDVQIFLAAFSAGGAVADWEVDGETNFFDVLAFLGDFSAGCP